MRTWDSFSEMLALQRELNRAFNTYLPERAVNQWPVGFLPGKNARTYPLINICEDKDNYYVEALAPGIDTSTIDISVVRNTLRISGEKKDLKDINPEQVHRSERSAGKFIRSVELPVEVTASGVNAKYSQGILTITLPKAEETKPKRITVDVQ